MLSNQNNLKIENNNLVTENDNLIEPESDLAGQAINTNAVGTRYNGQLSISLNEWSKINRGRWTSSNNQITTYGTRSRGGWKGMFTKETYDLRDSQLYVKWKPNGARSYGAFYIFLFENIEPVRYGYSSAAYTGTFSTRNRWGSSTKVNDNVWLFSRFEIDNDGNYNVVTSTSNFDDQGGRRIKSNSGNFPGAKNAVITGIFNDQYRGTRASITIGDVRIKSNAAPAASQQSSPAVACIDSDGGKNIYVKSNVSGINSNGDQINHNIESCLANYLGRAQGGPGVYEFYCVNNTLMAENMPCPGACRNGACIR